jgi:hypothetical protein
MGGGERTHVAGRLWCQAGTLMLSYMQLPQNCSSCNMFCNFYQNPYQIALVE